jgi:MinD superfamily P-loop ATPase
VRIAIASGKGGTGKTTIATNLALFLSRAGRNVCYADCDVEAPNGHIFLKPAITRRKPVSIPVPKVDAEKCTGCGECGKICRYSAIVCVKEKVLTFPELCHGCGGCTLVCPVDAIHEMPREIGVVEEGNADGLRFVHGKLNIGEPMAPPLIREVKRSGSDAEAIIVDAPPGTSCPVIESVKGSDYVLLVTEPTPFGLHDLKLAVEMIRQLGLPFGIVVNRSDIGDGRVRDYAERERITLLLEIPDDRKVAEAYSRGEMILSLGSKYEDIFSQLAEKIAEEVDNKMEKSLGAGGKKESPNP